MGCRTSVAHLSTWQAAWARDLESPLREDEDGVPKVWIRTPTTLAGKTGVKKATKVENKIDLNEDWFVLQW